MTDGSFVDEETLARTYDGGYHSDGWDVVEQYRRAVSYARRHDVGSSATASSLELPRGRIRPWVDENAHPDPIRAIDTARNYGWLNCEFGDREFTALNTLVANVFSGGSITETNYVPSFSLNHLGQDSHVIDALELAGVDYEVVADRTGRGDEARPTTDASVLGRVLAVLGAPVGPKTAQHLSLPTYLEDAPDSVREQFVYAYLENRAVEHNQKATLTITEERNRDYLQALADLIDDVAEHRVELGKRTITISADAARNLGTVK